MPEDEGFWSWLRRRRFEIGASIKSPDEIQESFRERITPSTLVTWSIFNVSIIIISFSILLLLKPFAPFVIDVLTSLPIFYGFLTIHEVLHALVAVALGYATKFNYGSTCAVSVLHENNQKWKKDSKKIALAPYFFIFPMAFFLLTMGILYSIIGLSITGAVLFVTHIVFLPGDLHAIRG